MKRSCAQEPWQVRVIPARNAKLYRIPRRSTAGKHCRDSQSSSRGDRPRGPVVGDAIQRQNVQQHDVCIPLRAAAMATRALCGILIASPLARQILYSHSPTTQRSLSCVACSFTTCCPSGTFNCCHCMTCRVVLQPRTDLSFPAKRRPDTYCAMPIVFPVCAPRIESRSRRRPSVPISP